MVGMLIAEGLATTVSEIEIEIGIETAIATTDITMTDGLMMIEDLTTTDVTTIADQMKDHEIRIVTATVTATELHLHGSRHRLLTPQCDASLVIRKSTDHNKKDDRQRGPEAPSPTLWAHLRQACLHAHRRQPTAHACPETVAEVQGPGTGTMIATILVIKTPMCRIIRVSLRVLLGPAETAEAGMQENA